jgi:hypothetical protein
LVIGVEGERAAGQSVVLLGAPPQATQAIAECGEPVSTPVHAATKRTMLARPL